MKIKLGFKKTIWMSMTLMMGLFAACSSDELDVDGTAPTEEMPSTPAEDKD